jgi:hypothetical protein
MQAASVAYTPPRAKELMAMNGKPPDGKLKAGDPVYVKRSPNDSRGRSNENRYLLARVTSAARVWVTVERAVPAGSFNYQTWRMRLDTRDEGSQYPGNNASVLTPEQYAWEVARGKAVLSLREQGIQVDYNSPWYGREAELLAAIDKVTAP